MQDLTGVDDEQELERRRGATGNLYGYIWSDPILFESPIAHQFPSGAEKWLSVSGYVLHEIEAAWVKAGPAFEIYPRFMYYNS